MTETQITQMIKFTDARLEFIRKVQRSMEAGNAHAIAASYDTIISELEGVKDYAISLLPKERKDIENVFTAGALVGGFPNYIRPASDYFKDKFTQYKTEQDGTER